MYLIKLNKKQLSTISDALEVYARLGIGQFRDALECLPLTDVFPEGWHDDMATIGRILSQHTISNVDGYTSYLSIHNEKVDEESKIAWDLHQVFRRRLSWDAAAENGIIDSIESPRKWPEMSGVNYDDPLKVSDQPLAVAEKV